MILFDIVIDPLDWTCYTTSRILVGWEQQRTRYESATPKTESNHLIFLHLYGHQIPGKSKVNETILLSGFYAS